MQRFVSARGRAQLTDVLLAAFIALASVLVASGLTVAVAGRGELARMVLRGAALMRPVAGWLLTGVTIAFGLWAFRVSANLPAMGLWRRRIAPDTALILALVPLVNLVALPAVAALLWLDSDPTPPSRAEMARALVPWVGGTLLGLVLMFMAAAELVGSVRGTALIQAASAAGLMLAAASALRAVRAIQRRQDEQWADVELRRAVPRPTAAGLR